MPHHCCVPNCTSDTRIGKCQGVSFHSFPTKKDLKEKWLKTIKREVNDDFQVNKHTRVCSLHFEDHAYLSSVMGQVRKRLKRTAIPTIFQWKTPKAPRRMFKRDRSIVLTPSTEEKCVPCVASDSLMMETSFQSADLKENETPVMESPEHSPANAVIIANTSSSSEDSLLHVEADPSPHKEAVLRKHKALLLQRSNEKFTILRFSSSDKDIRYYTGFPSFLALCAFFHFLHPECNFLYYVGSENTSKGKPYRLITKRGPLRSLSPMEELFLTLVRLRKGLPEKVIGDLYNLSEGHISKIVNTWIIFLYDRLRCLPIWPSREHVDQTMPPAFKFNFPKTRVIIDCTEIFIEQPSASVGQRETFSSYKHHNTAKGLIGISPNGQISYISSLYAGRCSDKKIVRHCGLYEMLEAEDAVMADKGFDIKPDLEERGFSLAIPPFLEKQNQFTAKQLEDTKSIAVVRVHVERAVRKVKEFEIIRNTVFVTMCPMLEKIWIVCGHLANFTGNLFKQ